MSKRRRTTKLHSLLNPESSSPHATPVIRHPVLQSKKPSRVRWFVIGLLALGLLFLIMGNEAPKPPQDPLVSSRKVEYKSLDEAASSIDVQLSPNVSTIPPGQNPSLK